MNLETVEQITTASLDQFWKAVTKLNNQPQIINRKLCGVTKLLFCKLVEPEYIENTVLLSTMKDALTNANITEISAPWVIDKFTGVGIKVAELEENSMLPEPGRYIYVKILLPRVSDFYKPCLELVVKDTVHNTITFMGMVDTRRKQSLTANFPYQFQYLETKDKPKIWLVVEDFGSTNLVEWLKKRVFNKVIKWAEATVVDDDEGCSKSGTNSTSLYNLIDTMFFNRLYQDLKEKYGSEISKIWPGIKNPQTFVCEDVAVAAYLLLLWEEERQRNETKEKQTFLDLKCGNGLLVHILNREGHSGKGIDTMKRNIWSIYPATTKLEVQAITPSDFVYPEADWVIGNQSDELTPWIPIIAARSSYKCKFFILPCCPYELNGQEYQRTDSSRSQNDDYIQFLLDLCEDCGFIGKTDRLRIPSTKRTCIVGAERTYPEEDQGKIDESIKVYLQTKVKDKSELKEATSDICQNWSDNGQPYSTVERIRTQSDRGFVEDIIAILTEQVLVKRRLVTVTSSKGQEKTWNAGGTYHLTELAKAIPKWKLKKVKKDHGGLLKLLKNHGHMFHKNGPVICLKVPKPNVTNRVLKKDRPCWFHCNHPEGCPLIDEDCAFKH